MSEQNDQQVQQAADNALHEIARMHEHAVEAVWNQYPAPAPSSRNASTGGSGSGTGGHAAG